jgi:alkylhydroperoxidase family enzyme
MHSTTLTESEPPAMTQRVNYAEQSSDYFKKFVAFSTALQGSSIEAGTRHLVEIRASQINEATIHGERPLRLHHLAIWRESTLFAPRERAALAWTEALTRIPEHGVPDELFERVRGQLSEKEISDLTFIVMSINAWNRANVAFKTVPGSFDAAFGLDKANLV